MYGLLQIEETALYERVAGGSRGHCDLDSNGCFIAIFAMKGKQDGVAKLAVPAQPQSVVQTLNRVRLADIDVVVLRRSDRRSIPAVFHQRRKCKRLIAMLFVNAEEVDWRGE